VNRMLSSVFGPQRDCVTLELRKFYVFKLRDLLMLILFVVICVLWPRVATLVPALGCRNGLLRFLNAQCFTRKIILNVVINLPIESISDINFSCHSF
jgi:hypothetical protein